MFISGCNAVVLGRSKIVGSPMAQLLVWNDATVTIVHSKTKDIPSIVKNADIIVAAIGKPNFVKAEWLKPGKTNILSKFMGQSSFFSSLDQV